MKLKLLPILLFTMATAAEAEIGPQFESTTKLQTDLHTADEWATLPAQTRVDSSWASGYVTGVADAFSGIVYCPPEGTSGPQVIAIVKKFIAAHPEKWQLPAPVLIVTALSEVFPCKKQ